MRPATPADRLVPPYPNKEAARVANNGMYPASYVYPLDAEMVEEYSKRNYIERYLDR